MVSGVGTTYQSVKEYPGSGCFGGKCIVKHDDKLYWWGKDGAFMWDGNRVVRISDKIWNKLNNLKLTSGYKWFSFIFQDQWWTCVKYRASGVNGLESSAVDYDDKSNDYYNFVYDFKDNTWRVYDVPMVAAFNSQGGIDLGGLFFSSPLPVAANEYKTYRYGVDDATGGEVFSDNGEAITSTWITPQWDGSNQTVGMPRMPLYANMWEKYVLAIGTHGTGSFTSASLQYRTDNTSSYSNLTINTDATNTPFQHVYFPVGTYAHYCQAKFVVSATKRLDIYELYATYEGQSISRTFG